MSEDTDMKRVLYGLDGDPDIPVIAGVPNTTDMGPQLITLVGVGNPYWAWVDPNLGTDIMTADAIAADFSGAPLCSDDEQTNRNNIAGLIASPLPTGSGGKVWIAT